MRLTLLNCHWMNKVALELNFILFVVGCAERRKQVSIESLLIKKERGSLIRADSSECQQQQQKQQKWPSHVLKLFEKNSFWMGCKWTAAFVLYFYCPCHTTSPLLLHRLQVTARARLEFFDYCLIGHISVAPILVQITRVCYRALININN